MANFGLFCGGSGRSLISVGLTLALVVGSTACDTTTEADMPGGQTFNNYWIPDSDGDGYTSMSSAELDAIGYDYRTQENALLPGDCNDANSGAGPDTNPGAIEICDGIDNNCDGLIDGEDPDLECLECTVDADCGATEYCELDGNTCETVPCSAETACGTAEVVDHECVVTVIADCCLTDSECAAEEVCGETNTCEPIVCEAPNACTDASIVDHTCELNPIADCCWTDEMCPIDLTLPEGYVSGCVVGATPEAPGFCTECRDEDEDGWCYVGEFCDNELDDDGDGNVDCLDDDCIDDPACAPTCEDVTCGIDESCLGGSCYPTVTIDFDGDCECPVNEYAMCSGSVVGSSCDSVEPTDCDDRVGSPIWSWCRTGTGGRVLVLDLVCPSGMSFISFTDGSSLNNTQMHDSRGDGFDNDCDGRVDELPESDGGNTDPCSGWPLGPIVCTWF